MTGITQLIEGKKLPFNESHAFIIGINEYYRPLSTLKTAINDAEKLAEILAKEQGFNVHPVLRNAKREDIRKLLEETMPKKIKAGDRCLLYFAGHGIAEEGEGEEIPEGYLIPADAKRDEVASYYAMKDLYAAIRNLPCKHFLLIMDCCFSGVFKWWTRYRQVIPLMPKRIFKERYDRFVKDPAWQVITSTAYDQRAVDILLEITIGKRDDNRMCHSPFAKALFEGLQGAADIIPKGKGDGLITAAELYLYLRDRLEPQTIAINERIRQTPGIFPLEKHDKGEYVFINPRHPLMLPPIPDRSPYKGLQSFEENDMDLFYGRERVIKDLMQKIKNHNLVVVTGASGTGKSSAVKAGLLPELRQQGYDILPVIRPGKTPSTALEKIIHETNRPGAEISFNGDVTNIEDREADTPNIPYPKKILVVDQLEELITQSHGEEDRQRFIKILKQLLCPGNRNLFKVILTVRADFEPQFKDSELEPYWVDARYTVPPLTAEELREVIVKPTLQVVMEFEPPGLVDRVIEEVIQAPGALPLLSFTLNELYRLYIQGGRTNRALNEEDYKKLRGVTGALNARADHFYKSLDRQCQDTLRKIMLRMVSIEGSEPAGKRVLLQELRFPRKDDATVKNVIEKLLAERLIYKDNDGDNQTYIEPVHDALIRGWGELWKWINSYGKGRIELQTRVETAGKDHSQGKGTLWNDDPRLDMLKEELISPDSCLNIQEIKFVEESIKLKKRKRNRAWTIAVSVMVILSALAIFSFYKAKEARKEARTARANYLASQAQLRLESDPAAAISLAEQAYLLDANKNVTQVLSAAAAQTLEHPLYNLNLQHDYDVNTAVFSHSGNRMLTASEDKTAKLWDIQGKLLHEFKHENAVISTVFSPDDRTILTVSRDKTARLWNLQGRIVQAFTHEKTVNSAEFSPDGQTILTASDDNTARLWNLQGTCLKTILHRSDVNVARYSPDGTRVLTLSRDLNGWVSDIGGSLIKGVYPVTSAAFSSDGKYIVFILFNNTVKLWNLADNTEKVFKNFKEVVHRAAVIPADRGILFAYLGGAIEIRDLNSKTMVSFGHHKESINSIVFSPDGTRILTASRDGTVKLWNIDGGLIADFSLHKRSVLSATFSPDGTRILTASRDETAKMWDLKDQLATRLIFHQEEVSYVGYSPAGNEIITISGGNNVQLWDRRGNPKANLNKHTKTVHTAVFSPDGTRILTASADNTAKLWNLEGDIITDFNRHTDNVNSAVFSPDGRTILTASYDGTAGLWDQQGNVLQTYKHRKDVISARYSPDGRTILTASFDETAKLWDLQGNLLKEFNKQYGQVKVAIFSPDGTKVLTVSASARLWDVKGEHLTEFNLFKLLEGKMRVEETPFVADAEFSPDSRSVLTVYNDNSARLWDLEGKLLMQVDHRAKIYSACFSPNGTWIVTASADSTAKLWDLHGNLWAEFDKHKGDVYSAVFSPDGSMILSASADKTVMLRYTPEGIIQWLAKTPHPSYKLEGNSSDNKK